MPGFPGPGCVTLAGRGRAVRGSPWRVVVAACLLSGALLTTVAGAAGPGGGEGAPSADYRTPPDPATDPAMRKARDTLRAAREQAAERRQRPAERDRRHASRTAFTDLTRTQA